jgi:hypothetical protein
MNSPFRTSHTPYCYGVRSMAKIYQSLPFWRGTRFAFRFDLMVWSWPRSDFMEN